MQLAYARAGDRGKVHSQALSEQLLVPEAAEGEGAEPTGALASLGFREAGGAVRVVGAFDICVCFRSLMRVQVFGQKLAASIHLRCRRLL